MANKSVKRCLVLLAIRKMEMKTTVKFQYVATGMAKIKKTDNANYW